MNTHLSCDCQPIAEVGILGGQITQFQFKLSHPCQNIEIKQLKVAILSENTDNKWEGLEITTYHFDKIKQYLLVYVKKDIFCQKTKLLKFLEQEFKQQICHIQFNISFDLVVDKVHCTISNQQIKMQPIRVLEVEKFITSTFDDLHYNLYQPEPNNVKHPLIICLHGGGEGGMNGCHIIADKMVTSFLQPIHQKQFDYPYILAPQCPSYWLDEFKFKQNRYYGVRDYTDTLVNLVKEIIQKYNIDTSRVYVIGASMGGYQALRLISCMPDLFCAGVICCPAKVPLFHQLDTLKHIPLWFIHSQLDDTVPIQYTNAIVNYLQSHNDNIEKTDYAKVIIQDREIDPHCVFLDLYEDHISNKKLSVFQWLASQHKE
ncbi:alpha/beta fold hydrolase [Lonepinella sp. BR2357]|uniref:carboxylesterase family protein n=1 Tax=Lonepinella sp. BR2357 TaxID=3434549 RepID=UPI003F6DC721